MFLLVLDTEADVLLVEQLYLKYKNLLFIVANDILHDQHDSEDALQQTMIRVINNIDKIKNVDSRQTRNFLCIICRNIALTMLNKNKSANTAEIEDDLPDMNEDIEALILTKDMYIKLKEFILTQDKKYQDVLFLKLNHDLSSEEIAKILDIRPETVRKRLERGRRLIKIFMAKEGMGNVK